MQTFRDLEAFAERVASELIATNRQPNRTDASVTGWRLNEIELESSRIYGRNRNTELTFKFDQLWLTSEGALVVAHRKCSTVTGIRDSSTTERYETEPLIERYARMRDGVGHWNKWTEKRSPHVTAEISAYSFRAPRPDRPPFVSISKMLSVLRRV